MANRERERGTPSDARGLTQNDIAEAITKGQIAQENLRILGPYFSALREKIFYTWRMADAKDVDTLRWVKYELLAIDHLEELMTHDVTRGKVTAEKLEAK